jgi:hypothetical protein
MDAAAWVGRASIRNSELACVLLGVIISWKRTSGAKVNLRSNVLTDLVLVFALLAGLRHPVGGGVLERWHLRYPPPAGPSLHAAIHGGAGFVVVGDTGTILTSDDGVSWTNRQSGTSRSLYDVAWGNGTYVAVGEAGAILTSSDRITWISRDSGRPEALYGIVYGKEVFVAVGEGGVTLRSADGKTWTGRHSEETNRLHAVTFGNDLFVAAGGVVAATLLTSPDGITWSRQTPPSPPAAVGNGLNDIAYGNDVFVAVASGGNGAGPNVLTSPDGITWSAHNSTGGSFFGVAFGDGRFVAVQGVISFTSSLGESWQIGTSSRPLSGVCYGGGMFVGCRPGGHGRHITRWRDLDPSSRGAAPIPGRGRLRRRNVCCRRTSLLQRGKLHPAFDLARWIKLGPSQFRDSERASRHHSW